jgi:uncharacterized protein (TIGR03437 family)
MRCSWTDRMPWKMLLCLALASAAGAQPAASGFLLGIDYVEWGPERGPLGITAQITADSAGELYILTSCTPDGGSATCMTKLSADGKTILWQTILGYPNEVAVGADGGVYVVAGEVFNLVATKLAADGTTVLWTTVLGPNPGASSECIGVAVDSTGRTFVAVDNLDAGGLVEGCKVVRLNAAGAVDATFLNVPGPLAGVPGVVSVIEVDPTGSNVVIAIPPPRSVFGFQIPPEPGLWAFARLAADGTWTSFTPQQPVSYLASLAVAPNGDAALSGSDPIGNWFLQRIDPSGKQVFTNGNLGAVSMALDPAGNAYVTGYRGAFLHPVKNSLAPCGTTWLSAFAPDGSLLQTTYVPGGVSAGTYGGAIATGPNSTVYVLGTTDGLFPPTQLSPFPESPYCPTCGSAALFRLSPHPNAQTFPLACVGNAASLGTGPVAPGELVTLVGNGLGPQQGVEPQATLETPYPIEAANVEVTFDGIPAPLLWVQDSQINVVVPWSVTGSGTGGGPTTQVCVTYNNVPTNCLGLPVAQTAPGVFTVDGAYAAAVNQDGTTNSASNPAPAGSLVSVWATGLGPITPAQADGTLVGLPLPTDVLQAAVGSISAVGAPPIGTIFIPFVTTYAGPAPYKVAGTSQINFRPGGGAIYVEVGSTTSPAFQVYVAGQ